MNVIAWVSKGILVLAGLYLFNRWNQRPVDWNPDEIVRLLDSWIDGNVDYKCWDYFEACAIADPELEAIRKQAIEAVWLGSPYIESCGGENERLNARGKELFRQLKDHCKEYSRSQDSSKVNT